MNRLGTLGRVILPIIIFYKKVQLGVSASERAANAARCSSAALILGVSRGFENTGVYGRFKSVIILENVDAEFDIILVGSAFERSKLVFPE